MARAATWAIRVTYPNGKSAFLRHGARPGTGPIVTFRTEAQANDRAAFLRDGFDPGDVLTVIQRSHGRTEDC